MNDPDRALVEGLMARDLCAVQLLVSRKFDRLARFLLALMPGRGNDAEALAVKVLRTARDMIDSFEAQDILFDTWLHRLSLSLWREEVRSVNASTMAANNPFAAMPEKVRFSLFLSVYQGLEAREIARILSCTIADVERHLKAARLILSLEARPQMLNKGAGTSHAA